MSNLMAVCHNCVNRFLPTVFLEKDTQITRPPLIKGLRRFYEATRFRILDALKL